MFLKTLCLFVCVNLFSYSKCSIPVVKLCVNPSCQEPISMAKGKVKYQPSENQVLGFKPGQIITITSKSEKKDDYWGAVIDGEAGYVPAEYVQEFRVFYGRESLKPVPVQTNTSKSGSPLNNKIPSEKVTNKSTPPQLSHSVAGVPSNMEKPNPVNESINPGKSFQIVEGTTIYENDEITPSATANVHSAPQTVAPVSDKVVPERAAVPPEVVEMNASYKGQDLKNVKNVVVESVKDNDEEAVIESKDFSSKNDENDDEDEDEVEGEGEDEDDEEEEEDDNAGNDVNNDMVAKNGRSHSVEPVVNEKPEEMIASSTQSVHSGVVEGTPETVVNVIQNSITDQRSAIVDVTPSENLSNKNQVPTQKVSSSLDLLNEGKENLLSSNADLNVPSQQPVQSFDILNGTTEANHFEFSNKNSAPVQPIKSDVSAATPQSVDRTENNFFGATTEHLEPQVFSASPSSQSEMEIQSETFSAVSQSTAGTTNEFSNTAPQQMPVTVTTKLQPEASAPTTATPFFQSDVKFSSETSQQVPGTPQLAAETNNGFQNAAAAQQMPDTVVTQKMRPEASGPTTAVPFSQPEVKFRGEILKATSQEIPAGTYSSSPQSMAGPKSEFLNAGVQQMSDTGSLATSQATSHIPDAVIHKKVSENPTAAFASSEQSIISKTSTIFNQFSVSADSLPDASNSNASNKRINLEEPDKMIQENVDVTAETLPSAVVTEVVQSTAADVIPEPGQGKVKITTEASVVLEATTDLPGGETNIIRDTTPEHSSNELSPSTEKKTEELGLMSQITGIFSSWLASGPKKDVSSEKEVHFKTDFQDVISETPSGSYQNPESDVESKDGFFWSAWLPTAFGLDHILTQNNTLVYLVVTAVTVSLFTLGHNFIEKRGVTGPLIAKINKLEHELLVTSKECFLLKDEIQSAREKITLYENSANDELIVTLQAELEESKKIRTELESSIEVLQQELDAATEAGLDLNKMLTEVLTQKGGSDSLLKSVENLQAQLDSQQEVINEMTKKLGLKNQENEDLQSALNTANEKSQNLEEEITDMKHNLNLHLKEKEELTKDLNNQINQLKTRIHQLAETKGKEISKLKKESEELQRKLSETASALTVKEEEVKALKESMKVLKTSGDVQIETVFDVSRIKAELAKEIKENHSLLEKLQKEEANGKALAEQVKDLDGKVQEMKKRFEEAEAKKDEAEKKLEVLSTYFKEKETQLQKELGLQEALWAQKKGDEKAVYNMMKSLQEEVESYKSQNETLKKEILDQERALKSQMASFEQKAYENWVAARQAERKLEESKQEMAQLRNRLILVEKNSSNVEGKGNLRSSEELNGVEATSPILHETSSPLLFPPLPLDPNNSALLPPGFMPPPMFIPPPMGGFMPPPPFLPGDRRPPPLGRMSSPPLNSRFSPSSPADYPFERMSSPPLSPPGRIANEDREHYRHRTPPFPPPLHPRNWDDNNEGPGFIPISSQRDSRRDHKGSNISSEHSSSESLDKSSRHSGRV